MTCLMIDMKCLNCKPGCESEIRTVNCKLYHFGRKDEVHGFDDRETSIIHFGSKCPHCGCNAPVSYEGE